MSRDDQIDRRIDWTARGTWLLLGLILAIAAWTLGTVSIGQGDERAALDVQNELLRDQNETLTALVERQRRVDSQSDERLQSAVDDVEELLIDYFARHDQNSALKLNELLDRIAQLLGRPAGIPVDPVTAEGLGGQPAPTRPGTRSAAPTSPDRSHPAPTTTTTRPESPGQSGLCDRLPDSPICRSNR